MLIDLESSIKKYGIKVNGVIHIGAHYGQEFNTYKNLGIDNIVFFEPIPETFKILKNNVGDKAILHETALGNSVGEIDMNVETVNHGQSSSILTPYLHLQQYPSIVFNKKVKVSINKLDNFLNYSKNHNFIVIDVQGYELEVFKGSEEYLKYVDGIITEVNRDEVYKDCTKINELDEFLLKYSFKRVETNWVGGIWGDALYVNQKFIK
jgi:FkbM family methyltransferase